MQTVDETDIKRLSTSNPSGSKPMRIFLIALVLLLPVVTAAGAEVSGKVINKTIGKPAVGDEVLLMDVSADMKDAGHTRTDRSGNFHFRVGREGVPWLMTVTHDGVRYEAALPAGEQSVEIEVFDKTGATADVKSGIQVLQLENDTGHLRATEMLTLMNLSNPPRTIQKEELFSIPLPAGAVLLSSLAEAPGESVVKSIAVAPPQENRCYFNFPLRPGTTKIQLQYQLVYSGAVTLVPYIPFPADMFGVVTPASMQFQPSEPGVYTRQPDGSGGTVELIRNAHEGSGPSFTVLGSGAAHRDSSSTAVQLPSRANTQQEPLMTAAAETALTEKNLRPDHMLWPIFMAITVVASTTVFVYLRRAKHQAATGSDDASTPDKLIREQLFSLELDRLQNRISKSKYATARSLLEKKLAARLAKTSAS